jgi:hypothetical protein
VSLKGFRASKDSSEYQASGALPGKMSASQCPKTMASIVQGKIQSVIVLPPFLDFRA